jgi:hypothetical protein
VSARYSSTLTVLSVLPHTGSCRSRLRIWYWGRGRAQAVLSLTGTEGGHGLLCRSAVTKNLGTIVGEKL